ncbi:MAG TPA: hypothetical protein ENK09_10080 [Nitrospirae bacterium]|nr:hypothetical protein [Nitrospirota bacterium]
MALMQWDLNNKRQSLLGLKCIDKGLDVRYMRYCYMAFFTTSGPIGFVSLLDLVYNNKKEVTLLFNPVVGLFL